MEVAWSKLRETSGSVALHLGFLALGGAILLMIALSIFHVFHTMTNVTSRAEAAVLSAAASNVSGVYGGSREASGTARKKAGGGWSSVVLTSDVLDKLAISLGAVEDTDGNLVRPGAFRIVGLDTRYINTEGSKLNFRTTFKLEISLPIANLPPLQFQRTVRTTYEPKF